MSSALIFHNDCNKISSVYLGGAKRKQMVQIRNEGALLRPAYSVLLSPFIITLEYTLCCAIRWAPPQQLPSVSDFCLGNVLGYENILCLIGKK